MTNFGVIIRSIGERTEQLCVESCKKYVAQSNLHIIKNYYPAYKAYKKMYEIALEKKYDWFLAVDADVVLKSDWFDIAQKTLSTLPLDDYFVISFSLYDKFLGPLDRGNRLYNGSHVERALWFLENKTKYSLKAESYVSRHMAKDAPPKKRKYSKDTIIGYHGYEQFYKHIFYRFFLRKLRLKGDKENENVYNEIFKANINNSDKDYLLAEYGWKNASKYNFYVLLMRIFGMRFSNFQKISKYIEQEMKRYRIDEKRECDLISINEFYQKYKNEIN